MMLNDVRGGRIATAGALGAAALLVVAACGAPAPEVIPPEEVEVRVVVPAVEIPDDAGANEVPFDEVWVPELSATEFTFETVPEVEVETRSDVPQARQTVGRVVTSVGDRIRELGEKIGGLQEAKTRHPDPAREAGSVQLMDVTWTPAPSPAPTPPLYVIDGVIMNAQPNLEAIDIDRIEVIKGAAAARLYGSRAANGVISVYTKQRPDPPGIVRAMGEAVLGRPELPPDDAPLPEIFVDGELFEGELGDLASESIDAIEVLKDANGSPARINITLKR